MRFYKVRDELLQGKNISNLKLRVTFYARVSTETDEQLNSLDNQISFFKDYIKSNQNWTYVEGYIDEGISASGVKKRKNFLRMIQDSQNNLFDLIITKEVSRFSRNLSDSIRYTQELIANDVGVYFQSNGINTYDPNSEFILNMMASVAQEEVKRLSSRVKWGHKEAIKKGRVLGSNQITGYKKDNAKLVIVEEEALKVQKIFELYATGKYGLHKLSKELYDQGLTNTKGNIYDKDTLKRIIQNPKYKGYYRGHTTEVINYRTKKRIHIPLKEQVIYKDENIPAIVSEELWEKANRILSNRSQLMKENNSNARKIERKYCYSSKIYCGEHNIPYQRMTNQKNKLNPRWACSNYIKYRLSACESPIIKEKDLNNIFVKIMEKLLDKEKIIEDMLAYYSNLKADTSYLLEINKIKGTLKTLESKKEKILELNISNNLSNEEFKIRNDQYNIEISKLNKELNEIKRISDTTLNLSNIKKSLIKEVEYTNNVSEFIDIILEKIMVYKENNARNHLLIKMYLKHYDKKTAISKDTDHPLMSDVVSLKDKHSKSSIYKINIYLCEIL